MSLISEHTAQFRSRLRSILMDEYSHDHLNDVVSLAHAFAILLLRKKFSAGKINFTIAHLELHDMAYDCIAELFRRDSNDSLVQFKAYFSGLEIDELTDAQLVDHLRRLVFSKVEQGIFRIYAEHDASLAKILRNMKLAVNAVKNFVEVERFGEVYLVPVTVNANFHLPIMPVEALQRMMYEIVKGKDRIPDILARLSLRLTNECEYARAVSLIGTAIAVRIVLSEEVTTVEETGMAHLEIDDMEALIERVLIRVKHEHRNTYVTKKKVTQKEYNSIFMVVRKNLKMIIIDNDGLDSSLYDHMANEVGRLSRPMYQKRYKPIVEYMLTLTKKEIGKEFKREGK